MRNNVLAGLCDAAGKKVMHHLPEVLAGLGIAGFFTAGVWAVAETPKALENIKEKKEELGTDQLTFTETVKCVWRQYIPPIGLSVMSAGCVIGGTKESLRRNAALATIYAATESTLRDYREKVREEIGATKANRIDGAVAEKQVKDHPAGTSQLVITSGGNVKCYEQITCRYFMSDAETIKRAENRLNARIIREGYVSLNDFFDEIGLKPCEHGDLLGWNTDKLIDVKFDHCLDENNVPCLVVSFWDGPFPKYDSLH